MEERIESIEVSNGMRLDKVNIQLGIAINFINNESALAIKIKDDNDEELTRMFLTSDAIKLIVDFVANYQRELLLDLPED
jgi:hypothetical protein